MSYRLAKQERRHRSRFWQQIAVMGLLIGLTILLAYGTGFVSHAVFLAIGTQGRVDTTAGDKITRRQLLAQIDELEQQLARTEADRARIQILEGQLRVVESIVGREDDMVTHIAAVIRPPQFSLYQTMVIDQGAGDGVRVNQRVIADGVYLGLVKQVYPKTSLVQLATAYGHTEWARTFDTSDVIRLEGNGSANYLAQVSRFIDLEIGDIVVDPSYSALIMGIVEDVRFDPRDPVQEVLLRAPLNLGQITVVELWEPALDMGAELEAEYDQVEGARILREVLPEEEEQEDAAASNGEDTLPQ